jgi:hypothetical protein
MGGVPVTTSKIQKESTILAYAPKKGDHNNYIMLRILLKSPLKKLFYFKSKKKSVAYPQEEFLFTVVKLSNAWIFVRLHKFI